MTSRSDRAAEAALLAACMTSKMARDETRRHLVPSDFDDPRHEAVWLAMCALDRHGKAVDAVTLMATLKPGTPAAEILPELVTAFALPDNAAEYAAIIRGWGVRRALDLAVALAAQEALNPAVPAGTLAAKIAARFIAIRDGGASGEDVTALTLGELLDKADDEPQWLIPGLLERRDRLMLTGEEGLGKSHLLRQIALHASAGLDPFTLHPIEPVRTLIIDAENSESQFRRRARPAAEFVAKHGQNPRESMMVETCGRLDIRRDRDLGRIHQLVDAWQPGIVVIGPIYKLVPVALQTDDEAAPVLAALDTIRERDCALLIEAHAGHAIGKGGIRDLRPRGSSALLGWPEFGYGMRNIGTEGYADLVPWRGNREEREWPQRMRRADGYRWIPHEDLYGYNQGGASA